jgi:dihydrofolate reductase
MRHVVYGGAMSLDGFIAGPHGEYDWIVMDPDIDFTALMGNAASPAPGIQNVVFSRTLRPGDCPAGTILSDDAERDVGTLRDKPGKDIALFGGGELFRSLLAAGLVDELHFNIIPVLLGGGIPMLPPPANRGRLELIRHRVYGKTGTVGLEYAVLRT